MVKISPSNKEEIRKYLSNILTLINIYQTDLREERPALIKKEREIKVLIQKEKWDAIDLKELNSFCKNEWKELTLKAINEIKNEINLRKTRGMRFSDILFQLDKTEEDLIDISDYELEKFEDTYSSDIRNLGRDAKERIEIEGFANRQKKKNYVYNVIIAAVFLIVGLYFRGL